MQYFALIGSLVTVYDIIPIIGNSTVIGSWVGR